MLIAIVIQCVSFSSFPLLFLSKRLNNSNSLDECKSMITSQQRLIIQTKNQKPSSNIIKMQNQQQHRQQQQADQRLQNVNQIKNLRLRKQLQYLDKQYDYEVDGNDIKIKNALPRTLIIRIPEDYPFAQPSYAYQEITGPISEVIQYWSPKYKILEMISYVTRNIEQKCADQKILEKYPIYQFFKSKFMNTFMIILFSILIRILVGLGSYSGKNDWPQLGDFQAHRNWISITHSRPIQQWYHQQPALDDIWWRIDYPPISAYLSYLFSFLLKKIEPSALFEQQGYQSIKLTAFMRATVIIVETLSTYLFVMLLVHNRHRVLKNICLFIVLIRPDIILIDHGHFQYNSLPTGLISGAFYCLLNSHYYACCFLFTMAIHTKQMSVYYALAFLAGLIGQTYKQYRFSMKTFLIQIVKYGLIVLLLSVGIWLPWLSSLQLAKQPFNAIFPVYRGLYQLKVPNFWCITDTIFNWQLHFSKPLLMAICFIISFIASIPSMLAMIIHPIDKTLYLGFFNIGMTFFMFSYHGHQKSVIFPITIIILLMVHEKQYLGSTSFCFDLIFSGCIGMFHLLFEDKLTLQFFIILGLFTLSSIQLIGIFKDLNRVTEKQNNQNWIQRAHKNIYENWLRKALQIITVIALFYAWLRIAPPQNLPYLYNLLFAAYAFLKFAYSLVLGNLLILYEVMNKKSLSKKQ